MPDAFLSRYLAKKDFPMLHLADYPVPGAASGGGAAGGPYSADKQALDTRPENRIKKR